MTIIPLAPTNGGPIDAGRMVGALTLAATALFLMCGQLPAPYNRWARNAAVAVYGVTLAGVLIYVGLWWLGVEF
jgi:hypothetical protein